MARWKLCLVFGTLALLFMPPIVASFSIWGSGQPSMLSYAADTTDDQSHSQAFNEPHRHDETQADDLGHAETQEHAVESEAASQAGHQANDDMHGSSSDGYEVPPESEAQTDADADAAAGDVSLHAVEEFLSHLTSGSVADRAKAAAEQQQQLLAAVAARIAETARLERLLANKRRHMLRENTNISDVLWPNLVSQQAAAAGQEDYDTAAALDDQLQKITKHQQQLTADLAKVDFSMHPVSKARVDAVLLKARVLELIGRYFKGLQQERQKEVEDLIAVARQNLTIAEEVAAATASEAAAAEQHLTTKRLLYEQKKAALKEKVHKEKLAAQSQKEQLLKQQRTVADDIEQLKAQLAAKEAQLMDVKLAVVDMDEKLAKIPQRYADVDAELALEAAAVTAAQVRLEADKHAAAEAAAAAKAAADELGQQEKELPKQVLELGAQAAERLSAAAAASTTAEAESAALRPLPDLKRADAAAHTKLRQLLDRISEAAKKVKGLYMKCLRTKLAMDKVKAENELGAMIAVLTSIKAGTKAVAEQKYFKEAANFTAEAKTLAEEIAAEEANGTTVQELEQHVVKLQDLETAARAKLLELESYKQDTERAAAVAAWRYLTANIQLTRMKLASAASAAVEAAGQVGNGTNTEAQNLQADLTVDVAAAESLEGHWEGFADEQRSMQA